MGGGGNSGALRAEPVDLVYLWCDAADPVWSAKREAAAERCGLARDAGGNAPYRFASRDELRYSLRSAEESVPWVRKVFIVLDDDIAPPAWLDDSAVTLVRLSEIMPARFLPCFSSDAMEHYIARIPGLAGRFLYANDDTMFNGHVERDFFYSRKDGFPYFRFGARRRPEWSLAANADYYSTIENAERLLRARFGMHEGRSSPMGRYPHHNVDAYVRDDMLAAYETFRDEIESSLGFPFRDAKKVQRFIYAGHAIAVGRGHFRRASFNTAVRRPLWRRLLPSWADSLQFAPGEWRSADVRMAWLRPKLFCFNDGAGVSAADGEWMVSWLARRFPARSRFEKRGGA